MRQKSGYTLNPMPATVYAFGEFTLDCGGFELCRNGRAIALERKPLELLILLARRQGEVVTRNEIAQQLWEREVFVDVEHGINTAIRKIRMALRDDSEEPRYVQTVTGKGYRFIAPVAGAVRANGSMPEAHAPALEANGTGAHTGAVLPFPGSEEKDEASAAADAKVRRRWLGFGVAVLVLGAGVVLAARAIEGRRATAARIHSLAVLPLDNLSGDPSQDYFADGMTDELTTMLAKDSTLQIVSRTSVMQYKRAHRPLREIAQALGVDGVVEGSVERSGNQVHMTLQLIRAETDSHVWAESYDREADDTALPDEAARAIAKRLNSAAPTTAAARYVNPAAHDALLRGRYLWFTDRMDESGAYFRKATEIQPDYADAWAYLSAYYGEGVGADVLDPRTSLQPMWDTAQKAMQLDPDLPDAHWVVGASYFIGRWDFVNADRELQRAISMDPRNEEYYYVRGCLLEAVNRFDEAVAMGKKVMELNPTARPYALAGIYDGARQYDAAIADLHLRQEAAPNDPELLLTLWDAQERKGDYRDAMETWAKYHLAIGDPQSAASLRRAYEEGGARGLVQWQLGRRLMQSKSEYVSPGELAHYYGLLGDKEKTLAMLEKAYQWHAIEILFIQGDPAFDFLHGEPRYRALAQKAGLPPSY